MAEPQVETFTMEHARSLASASMASAAILENAFSIDGIRFKMTYGGSHKSSTGISIKRFSARRELEGQVNYAGHQAAVLFMDDVPFLITKTLPRKEFIVDAKRYLWWMISIKSDSKDAIILGILKLYKNIMSQDDRSEPLMSRKDFSQIIKAAEDCGFDGEELTAIKKSAKGM